MQRPVTILETRYLQEKTNRDFSFNFLHSTSAGTFSASC